MFIARQIPVASDCKVPNVIKILTRGKQDRLCECYVYSYMVK